VVKCPFCGAELNHLVVYELVRTKHAYKVYLDGQWVWQYDNEEDRAHTAFCPECDEEIPLCDYIGGVEDFLDEEYVILRSDDPEIKRKEGFVLFRGKVYKVMEESDGGMLHLKLVKGEPVASIIGASLE